MAQCVFAGLRFQRTFTKNGTAQFGVWYSPSNRLAHALSIWVMGRPENSTNQKSEISTHGGPKLGTLTRVPSRSSFHYLTEFPVNYGIFILNFFGHKLRPRLLVKQLTGARGRSVRALQ